MRKKINTQKIKNFTFRFFCILLALILTQLNTPRTFAAVEDFLDKFAANNIMFYNPDECNGEGNNSGSTVLSGDTNAEKVWNYFIGKGLNDMQVAGIMGNAIGESGAVVTRASNDSYWGVFQFARQYHAKLWKTLDDAGLTEYYTNRAKYGESDESIPAGTRDKILQIQLDYVWEANEGNWTQEIQKSKSIGEATEVFLTLFERAVYNPDVRCTPILYYEPYKGELYQGTEERRNHAQNFFDEYSGKGTVTQGTSGVTITDGSNLTWIGDSLTAIYESTLKDMLSAVDIYAKSSKHFKMDAAESAGGESGMTILNKLKTQNKVRDILVFELSTNDGNSVTKNDLQSVHDTARDAGAQIIIFMTAYTTTIDYSTYNQVVRDFAKDNSDVFVADWEALIKDKVSDYLGSDGVHEKDAEAAKKFFQLFIDTINDSTTPMTVDECCNPQDGTSGDEIWNGEKYEMTEAQARGMASMANAENGGSVNTIKTEASQMANLFEQKHPDKKGNIEELINYIKNGGWYSDGTGQAYDENYGEESYVKAVKEVLGEGKRTLPPEVVQHATGTSQWIKAENDGQAIDVSDRSQFKRGITKITELFGSGAVWTFWGWADPDTKEGDPFGYEGDNAPAGNSTAGAQSDACCAKTIGGVTTMEIEGHTYAFPLAGATKANYLNPGGDFESVLSKLPCPSLSCHHDYHAVDMGLAMELVSGSEASEYGGTPDDLMYFSSGAPVVAFTSGTIAYSSEYKNSVPSDWWDKCGQIGLEGDDGNYYWLGHLDLTASKVSAGNHVEAGDEISAVGAPQCAQNTQAHLHIDNTNGTNAKPDSWTVEVMNKLWEQLPDSDSGSGMETCSTGSLPAGGMTLEQAQKFMEEYKNLPSPQVDDPWNIKANDFPESCGASLANCVEFSLYFVHRYTTVEGINGLPDGSQVVGSLLGYGFKDGGKVPKPYAIFSKGSSSAEGHTGVVLGIDEANNKIIIGEAGCRTSVDWIGAHEYNLSDWTNTGVVYAYTDGLLK